MVGTAVNRDPLKLRDLRQTLLLNISSFADVLNVRGSKSLLEK
jgi:hypothetical protein